ncbi:mediator complex subunit SOH1 KNAG_0F02520 [Huiozyma naganishii CBS 8797]|uniref:Mediator of RNA polymerase II transcription subunit 31 n=1 Tax=Huiozyma naganishii (strain ATCC MYA-139 / BCRC 22969 / CBS 8797 / KCTC 17520 / NBRC 10181 / NCYC 3082 / Yp74L-3) TaxID=1071383 RepID=J7S065_HUIN7|nr:hypothetical protein KNAG_0F02520 [Kazachstania naganishii CBS 8797]CCK70917.1 hypothetical protein KNAG_0F02520 [Kazachstania naganishii CBS 8797]
MSDAVTGDGVEGVNGANGANGVNVADTAPPQPGPGPLPTRFEVELEFVQSLANVPYVTYLLTTQQHLWKSQQFQHYLKYLEYWCSPPYSQCIVYPNGLFVLKLINGFLETHASVNDDGLLDGVDELPRYLQLHGGELMNEMVQRWESA